MWNISEQSVPFARTTAEYGAAFLSCGPGTKNIMAPGKYRLGPVADGS